MKKTKSIIPLVFLIVLGVVAASCDQSGNNLSGSMISDESSEEVFSDSCDSMQSETLSSHTESFTESSGDASSLAPASSVSQSMTSSAAENSKSASPAVNSPTPTLPVIPAREQLNDVSSHVWEGYYYFTANDADGMPNLYKKKTGSAEAPAEVLDGPLSNFEILDHYVYYNDPSGEIFRYDINANTTVLLYGSNYGIIKVAGLWIFALYQSQLYMLRTDGSRIKPIYANEIHDYATQSEIFGFDRGYCYYYETDQWYGGVSSGSILINGATVQNRVDYRAADPVPERYSNYLTGIGIGLAKVFFDRVVYIETGYWYQYLPEKSKKQCPKNCIAFMRDYVLCTYTKATESTSEEFWRFQNVSTKAVTDYPLVSSSYVEYVDELNNAIYYSKPIDPYSHAVVRITPEGTEEIIYTRNNSGKLLS